MDYKKYRETGAWSWNPFVWKKFPFMDIFYETNSEKYFNRDELDPSSYCDESEDYYYFYHNGSNSTFFDWGYQERGSPIEQTTATLAPFAAIAFAEPTPIGEIALGITAIGVLLYHTLNHTGNPSYPGPWIETQPDPTRFPYASRPPGLNNRNYFPQGNGNDFIKWMIRIGGAATLGKRLYDGLDPELYITPQDNTWVKLPFYTPIPNSNYPPY